MSSGDGGSGGEMRVHGGEELPCGAALDELRRKAAERDQYYDLLLRTKAEFANYQKRMEEERKRWAATAQAEILSRLLAASDQCRLAASRASEDRSPESLRGAICLVWAELERFLETVGVKRIPAKGEEFDPARHEAVQVDTRDDLPDATVVEELVPGYEFGDRVLRPAQVVVSKRPPRQAQGGPAAAGTPQAPEAGSGR